MTVSKHGAPPAAKLGVAEQKAFYEETPWKVEQVIMGDGTRDDLKAERWVREPSAAERHDARRALKPTNPKDRAATTRLDLSLFPDTAVAYGALAFTEGDLKYGAYNYREAGVLASVYIAALRRHVARWWNGEDNDPNTKVPHLASALACIAVLIDAYECEVLRDDRPPSADMDGLLTDFEELTKRLQGLFPDGPPRCTQSE